MKKLKVRRIGNSYGVILPKEILERLQVRDGDAVYATPTPDGVQLSGGDPDFQAAMEHFEEFSRRYRDALRELAK
jgi:putative addiction module antidote